MIEGLPRPSRPIHKPAQEDQGETNGRPQFEDCIGIIIAESKPFFYAASKYGMSVDDIFQVAALEVLRKLPLYDPSISALPTYLIPNIRGSIRREFRDRGRMIRLPRTVSEAIITSARTEDELRQTLHRNPSNEEVADYLGEDIELIKEAKVALASLTAAPASLDSPLNNIMASDLKDKMLVKDTIADDKDIENTTIFRTEVEAALKILGPRERRIIELYYGFGEEGTFVQSEIAEMMGISQVHVSRLLRSGERKISEFFKGKDFTPH